jgi:hypothetical protein
MRGVPSLYVSNIDLNLLVALDALLAEGSVAGASKSSFGITGDEAHRRGRINQIHPGNPFSLAESRVHASD